MKLTVEAFAQKQKCHTVHMEIVAASWTSAQGGHKCEEKQQDNPDAEKGSHRPVGGRKVVGNQQCGDIQQHGAEKIFAAPSCLFQDIQVRRRIDRAVIYVISSRVPVEMECRRLIRSF